MKTLFMWFLSIMQNIIIIIALTYLAIYFNKWWIILFYIIMSRDVSLHIDEGQKEKDQIAQIASPLVNIKMKPYQEDKKEE